MARPLRVEFDGAWYHVMNRGADHQRIFLSDHHRAMFLQLVGEVSATYRVEAHAYCLMETHYHLQIRTPTAGLARAMRHLDGVYTQRFNRDVGRDGPLFRGRYKSVLVGDDGHLLCVSRYIHLNPVDAKIVARPEDYAASSYRAYLGLEVAPWWLFTEETLRQFGPGDARRNYRQFVDAGIDDATRAFYAEARRRPVFGSDDFRERVEAQVLASGAGEDPERPEAAIVTEPPRLDVVAEAVCRAFEVQPYELRGAPRPGAGLGAARGALVLLGREIGGHPLEAIAAWAGFGSYAAASKAMSRLRARIATCPELRGRVDAARRRLIGASRDPSVATMSHAKT